MTIAADSQRQGRGHRATTASSCSRASRTRRRPSAARRWLPPEREEAWDGVRDATRFSAQSRAGPVRDERMFGGAELDVSEDSLYLNVWTPACDDAQAAGDGVDPRRRVHLRFGRHAVVRRHAVREARRRRRRHDQLPARARSGSCTSPTCSATSSKGPATPASSTRSPRSNGCATRSPRSAAIPTTSRSSASRPAAGSVGTLLGLPAARGLFDKAIPQSGASSWWATREARRRHRNHVRSTRLGVKAGDTDALRALTTEQIIDARWQR